jgi:hypothetical protein
MPERWRRTQLISSIGAPGPKQRLGKRLLVRQRQAFGQAGEGGGPAAQQHQNQILGARLAGERKQALRGGDAALVRNRMARVQQRDPLQRGRHAVRHHGHAPHPGITRLGHRRHLARRLAQREHDHPLGFRQMRRQHPFRVAGGDPGVEQLDEVAAHRALFVGRARR